MGPAVAPAVGAAAAPAAVPGGGTPDTGLTCLLLMARYFRMAADGDQVRHELGLTAEQPFGEDDILRAAKRLEIKARAITRKPTRLDRVALPAMGQWRDEVVEVDNHDYGADGAERGERRPGGWFILAKLADDKVLEYGDSISINCIFPQLAFRPTGLPVAHGVAVGGFQAVEPMSGAQAGG